MKSLIVLVILLTASLAGVSAQEKVYPSFLSRDSLPDGIEYLPAPPDTALAEYCGDYARYVRGKELRETARGVQAKADASMNIDAILESFEDSFGMKISAETTPEIYELCRLAETDAINGTYKAKKYYMRKRPYVQFGEGTLVPEEESSHSHSGSYPSSHSSVGWAFALILMEVNVDNQDGILKRGYEYGQSRVIAGYHYQTDVDAARLVASAVVARLHSNDRFVEQMAKAKAEYAKLKSKQQNQAACHQ